MKVIDHIQQAKDTLVSFEVLPPLKGKNIASLYQHLDLLSTSPITEVNIFSKRNTMVLLRRLK
jgi:methylenetetrahydrofolate reductase (NADPH)